VTEKGFSHGSSRITEKSMNPAIGYFAPAYLAESLNGYGTPLL